MDTTFLNIKKEEIANESGEIPLLGCAGKPADLPVLLQKILWNTYCSCRRHAKKFDANQKCTVR